MRDAVSDAGFLLLPVGLDWSEPEAERTFPELVGMPLAEQAYWWVSDIFADLTADAVRSAVRRAVSDPRLRSAAAALGAEIRDMPGPGPAADALEREVLRVR